MAQRSITVFYPGEFEDLYVKVDEKMICVADLLARQKQIDTITVSDVMQRIHIGHENIPTSGFWSTLTNDQKNKILAKTAFADDSAYDYPEDFGGHFNP